MNPISVQPIYAPSNYYQNALRPVAAAPAPPVYMPFPQDQMQFQRPLPAPIPAVQLAYPLPQNMVQIPQNLVQNSKPLTYTDKFVISLERVGQGHLEQIEGVGQVAIGAAKTAIYAPAGALEAFGRTAIALTGGEVNYPHPSPLDHMGKGLEQMAIGTSKTIIATGKTALAAVDTVAYAPLAVLEVTAHGTGKMVGGAVKAGTWVGHQVSNSFVGQEFSAGYREMMPSRN